MWHGWLEGWGEDRRWRGAAGPAGAAGYWRPGGVGAGRGAAVGDAAKARADYEAALRERDARIAELRSEIAVAEKTAESAEKLHAEMDELRRQGKERRVGFELKMVGARNVKVARALLVDYESDGAAERCLCYGRGSAA